MNHELIPVLICDTDENKHIRKTCHGAWMGFSVHNHFFAWQRDLSAQAIKGRRIKSIWDFVIETVLMITIIIGAIHACMVWVYMNTDWIIPVIKQEIPVELVMFAIPWWLLVFLTMYVVAQKIRHSIENEFVVLESAMYQPDTSMSWDDVLHIHKRAYHNMAHAWAPRAMQAFENASLKSQKQSATFSLYTLFEMLLETPDVQSTLIRLELHPESVKNAFHKQFLSGEIDHAMANGKMWQVIAHAYLIAAQNKDPKVTVFHVFYACFTVDKKFEAFFETLGIQPKTLTNALEWFKFMNRLSSEFKQFKKKAAKRSKSDAGSAMTGMATPMLNTIGTDLTKWAQFGYLPPSIGRESEIASMKRAFLSGATSVLLVGPHGVGKKSIIDGFAEEMVLKHDSPEFEDVRIIKVPITQVLSGASVHEYYQRLMMIVIEAVQSGNTMLALDGIEGVFGIQVGGGSSQDLSDALAELLDQTNLRVILTTTNEAYQTTVARSRLATKSVQVDVHEVDDATAIQILQARAFAVEAKHQVFFTYKAIEQCVELAKRFMQNAIMPTAALELMKETAASVRHTQGKNKLVRDSDVKEIVSEKTNIPITNMTSQEKEQLIDLEKTLHERVIGQDPAVKAVSDAVKRARTGISAGNRPIANFLFLGPTGVGKTETTKALAQAYFGSEDRMLRFDMSEYQDTQSIFRLIGNPGQQGTGMLTEAVKANPFSLILLDEFEKSSSEIRNVFLQIFDDGRVTDSTGQVVDFTNTIIIATSNAGALFIQDALKSNMSQHDMQQHLLENELQQYFRPELINRFDDVIVFTPLSHEAIEEIAHLMIHAIAERVYAEKNISLVVSDVRVRELAEMGYSPTYGARPMRRVIQTHVEDVIANALLEQNLSTKTIIIDDGGNVRIE